MYVKINFLCKSTYHLVCTWNWFRWTLRERLSKLSFLKVGFIYCTISLVKMYKCAQFCFDDVKWYVYWIPVLCSILYVSSDILLGSTKIIFEVSSLANASPQTISCCSVVHCTNDTLPWKCLVDSWNQRALDDGLVPVTRFAMIVSDLLCHWAYLSSVEKSKKKLNAVCKRSTSRHCHDAK